jgi:transposase
MAKQARVRDRDYFFRLSKGKDMKYKRKKQIKGIRQWMGRRVHVVVVIGIVWLALLGQVQESNLGWDAYGVQVIELREGRRKVKKGRKKGMGIWLEINMKGGWEYMKQSWQLAAVRSEVLLGLWVLSGEQMWGVVVVIPWLEWVIKGVRVSWPWLGQQAEMRGLVWILRVVRIGSMGMMGVKIGGEKLGQWWESYQGSQGVWLTEMVVIGTEQSDKEDFGSEIRVIEEGAYYRVDLGEWHLKVKQADKFQVRLLIIFLRMLEGKTERVGSRATRGGRRPELKLKQLGKWFKVHYSDISRWEKYWQEEDWANLLSLKNSELLTTDLRLQIVTVLGRFPWWSQKKVYDYLHEQGLKVTQSQVSQVRNESGFKALSQTLKTFFVISADNIRPRDESLVSQLLTQIEDLLKKVEQGQSLTPQEVLEVRHLQTACQELEISPLPQAEIVPWAQKLKWVLFAEEQPLADDDHIHCTYCGGSQVKPKSKKPRQKRYQDPQSKVWHSVAVYRYYCHNPHCAYGSFTHLPLGLLPYSCYPLEMRLQALQMYAWGHSSYRRTAQALGLSSAQAYRWVSAFGQELLPMAALFGVVRSSGVVGIDEKWVQVPHKSPYAPQPRRWMYVYLAVDVYTYDLLHIDIYQFNTEASTRSFLLALKAKGYRPKVIVTDLRREYSPAIADIFPLARHHECIFHALQCFHRQLKTSYGSDYPTAYPELVILKDKVDAIFQSRTKRTALKRFDQLMTQRQSYIALYPDVAPLFSSLQRHWPKLLNGIESTLIPRTNNCAELVIRRFSQHYQNFCGFDSLASARLFLGVFEKTYRFTPFSQDAQPRIRDKCPLQLAGYDISSFPISQVFRAASLAPPLDFSQGSVPIL